jgi:hypothetical protein
MTLVPGLELLALRTAPPAALPPGPVLLALEPPRPAPVVATLEEDDVEVVEVRSPLTIITWAAAVILAGIATVAAVLLLGPILGTIAVIVVTASILRRYQEAGAPEAER